MASIAGMIVLASLAAPARGAVVFPASADWNTIQSGGSHVTDPTGTTPNRVDIRGDSTYSSGFVVYDDTAGNKNLIFRMRLDRNPNNNLNRVWQFLLDTDSDSNGDWVLQLDARTNNQVELAQQTASGTTYNAQRFSSTIAWSGATATYSQIITADDGSSFDGGSDFFLSLAIPLADFQTHTGIGRNDSFRVALTTSTQRRRINRDRPFALGGNASLTSGWSDSFDATDVLIPEPGTWALFGLGGLVLAWRRRRAGRRALRAGGPKRRADAARGSAVSEPLGCRGHLDVRPDAAGRRRRPWDPRAR